jgi:uncharacterized protein (TIGR03437 family)
VPTTTGGTRVFINGIPAPVLYASANQVGAIVPYNLGNSSLVQLFVQFQGSTSLPVNLSVATMTPAIFTVSGAGTGQAAAINNKDGSINSASTPVKVGDFIQLYITGVGPTNPPLSDGAFNAVPLPVPVATPVSVTIGGQKVTPQFIGGAPGQVAGVFQVNAQIPSGITAGAAVPVVVTLGTASTQTGVTIAVTN